MTTKLQNTALAQRGLTLIEMMVSLTVASLLSIAVLSAFAAQSSVFINQAQRMQTTDDGRQSFEVLSRLIQHSQAGSFASTANFADPTASDISVSFSIPAGFPIWPNLDGTTATPFDKNFIHIKWANHNNVSVGTDKKVAYQIRVANSNSAALPLDTEFSVLAGMSTGINTRITEFKLQQVTVAGVATKNLQLTIEAKSGSAANSSKSFFEGFVLPRN